MRAKVLCAFREPFNGGFVEGPYPGAEIDVPADLVERLVADGHIARPLDAALADPAEPTVARRVRRSAP